MTLSKNNYAFTVQANVPATAEILNRNTLRKSSLIRVLTTKYFIGQVNDADFKIIGASAKSPACVLTGKFTSLDEYTTIVEIETRLHKAFLLLFAVWTALLFAAFTIPAVIHFDLKLLISGLAGTLVGGAVFRLMLHFFYVRARNKSIRNIESILK